MQCPTAEFASSATVPNPMPNPRVSLQCPNAGYPGSAQPQSIPATPQRLRCSQPLNTRVPFAGPNPGVSFPAVLKGRWAPNSGILLNSKCPTGSPKFPAVPQSLPVPSCRYPEAPNVRASLSKNQECRVVMSPGFRITLLIHAPYFAESS